MTRYVLVPGADGQAWYWHRLIPELEKRGHTAVAVELPKAASSTLADYAAAIVQAAQPVGAAHPPGSGSLPRHAGAVGASEQLSATSAGEMVLVAQSLGAFSAPLACSRLPVRELVLVNPMIPAAGETGGDWWENTGHGPARAAAAAAHGWPAEFDLLTGFFHDVPAEVTERAFSADAHPAELDGIFTDPWPPAGWPDLPTRIILGSGDRFFPLEFQRQIAGERLGATRIDVIDSGHLSALSRPVELAAALIGDRVDLDRP